MKVALVTGANRGIGKEICRQLAALGHPTVLTSRNAAKGKQAAQELQADYPSLVFHPLDITNVASVQACVAYVQQTYGRIDLLINNAGINYDTWHNALDADLTEVRQTLEGNLMGAWHMAQAVIPLMQQQGYGRVVNVSSGAGALQGMGGGTPGYSVSKAALNVLTIKLAAAVSGEDILVNAVCPGWVRTDMGGSSATRSVAQGAKGIIWAATLPQGGPSGGFFRDGKRIAW